jgi:predicted glutamine amidotransferase
MSFKEIIESKLARAIDGFLGEDFNNELFLQIAEMTDEEFESFYTEALNDAQKEAIRKKIAAMDAQQDSYDKQSEKYQEDKRRIRAQQIDNNAKGIAIQKIDRFLDRLDDAHRRLQIEKDLLRDELKEGAEINELSPALLKRYRDKAVKQFKQSDKKRNDPGYTAAKRKEHDKRAGKRFKGSQSASQKMKDRGEYKEVPAGHVRMHNDNGTVRHVEVKDVKKFQDLGWKRS